MQTSITQSRLWKRTTGTRYQDTAGPYGNLMESRVPVAATCPTPLYFGVSSTACVKPLLLVASQTIWPEPLIPKASVSVKPVLVGMSVLRSTSAPLLTMNGTCLPGMGGS